MTEEGPMIIFPRDPFLEEEPPAEEAPKRKRGRPKGWRAKTIQEANETPDVAWVVWREQTDVDGKAFLLVLEATTDPVRALEMLELNRGAIVDSVDLT